MDQKFYLDFFTNGKEGIYKFEKDLVSPIVLESAIRPFPGETRS